MKQITGIKYVFAIAVISSVMLLAMPGCHNVLNECLSGPGKTTTKRIGLYSFKNVKVRDNISLTLENGPKYEMEVTAGENIIPGLYLDIINNTLNIRNLSTCPLLKDPWKPVEVVLTVPDLDTVFVENQAEIRSLIPFKTDHLVVRVSDSPSRIDMNVNCRYVRVENFSGTSDVAVRGFADTVDCYHAGYGTIDFRSLASNRMIVNSASDNHCYIKAGEDYLFAVISGKGNIYYHNDPTRLDLKLEGTGRLIKVFE